MALKPHRPGAGGIACRNVAVALALAAAAFVTGWPKNAVAITVLDAQTFLLSPGKKVRLVDIVTPKSVQCGCVAECLLAQRARDFLQKTMSRAEANIRIESFGFDADGAMRAKVFVNSRDLSMLMIQNGFAQLAIEGVAIQWCLR
jgi:endonuclease YncB( thermonuclease family)